jgi:hypothetical protein
VSNVLAALAPVFLLILLGYLLCRHTPLNRAVWDGAERLVYGRLGDAAFTLRIEAVLTPPRHGDTVYLQVEAGQLHWFDPATGRLV